MVAAVVGVRNYVVGVTDRSIVVVGNTLTTRRPKDIVARIPRATRLGPFSGNGLITVAGIEMYPLDVSDLQAVQDADAELGYECPPPRSLW